MEFEALVKSRRSIRKYQEGITVSEEQIKEIIACTQNAPSWKNSQTARYYAAVSAEKIAELREKALPEFNRNNSLNAAAIIVTAFEAKRAGFNREGIADNELGDEWGAYDLGLANQLLLLKAQEMGFDSLVMGIRDADVLRKIFDIPQSQHIVSVIALGKRTEDAAMPPRKETGDIVRIF